MMRGCNPIFFERQISTKRPKPVFILLLLHKNKYCSNFSDIAIWAKKSINQKYNFLIFIELNNQKIFIYQLKALLKRDHFFIRPFFEQTSSFY